MLIVSLQGIAAKLAVGVRHSLALDRASLIPDHSLLTDRTE